MNSAKELLDVTLTAKSKLKALLPPADYLDNLYEKLRAETSSFLNPAQQILLEKIYLLVEHDYRKVGLVGKGYHCLEHSIELALMILRSWIRQSHHKWKSPNKYLPALNSYELLELTVAAILHDYDPHRTAGVPRVERTLHVLMTDEFLKDLIERLNLRLTNLSLLIERTDFPFTEQKEALWQAKLLIHFPQEGERKRFDGKAEKLALFDKAATYFSLSPEEADARVKGLEEEVELPAGTLLYSTYDFLKKENVGLASLWVPEEYRKKWEMVERHYFELFLSKKEATKCQ